jgi:hypothetical protein
LAVQENAADEKSGEHKKQVDAGEKERAGELEQVECGDAGGVGTITKQCIASTMRIARPRRPSRAGTRAPAAQNGGGDGDRERGSPRIGSAAGSLIERNRVER